MGPRSQASSDEGFVRYDGVAQEFIDAVASGPPEGGPAVPFHVFERPLLGQVATASIYYAVDKIRIFGYSFESNPMADAIIAQLREGVRVQMLINRNHILSNRPQPERIAPLQRLLREASENSVRFELKVYTRAGGNFSSLHASGILVDDYITVTGSFNFSSHSFTNNFEVMTVLYGGAMEVQLATMFDKLWDGEGGTSELVNADRLYELTTGRSATSGRTTVSRGRSEYVA